MTIEALKERLSVLESKIESAKIRADCEIAHRIANAGEPGPYAGAGSIYADLVSERNETANRIRGIELTRNLERQRELQTRLNRLDVERQYADRACVERAKHAAVERYLKAGAICRAKGWGWSFTRFQSFYESGKARYQGCPEDCTFFLDSPQARAAGVMFDMGPEREAVRVYLEAKDASNRILSEWNAVAGEIRILQREHPELQGVA